MRKRIALGVTVLICIAMLVSCGGSSPKIPSWLQGTWTSEASGEKIIFTTDNFSVYNKWDTETVNLANMITEVENEGGKVKIKNTTSGDTYTLTLINSESKMKVDYSFTKNSENEISFMGYKFTK